MKNIKTAFFILTSAIIVAISGCTGIGDLETVLDTASLENDKTPPVLTVTSHTNGQEVGGVYFFSGLVTDEGSGVSKVYVSVDGGAYGEVTLNSSSWTSSISLSLCGPHTNSVYAVDRAGNRSETVSVLVTRDTVPAITISGVADYNAYNTWTFNVGGSVSIDAPYTIAETALSINGGDYTNVGNNAWAKNGVTLTPNATNTLQARAIGSNGKTNFTALVHVIVDCENPVVDNPLSQYLTTSSPILTLTVTDNLSGISGTSYRLNGGTLLPVDGSNFSLSGMPEGSNTLTIYIADNAGNMTNYDFTTIVNTVGIYVATNGNDANIGIMKTSPVLSIQTAISNASAIGLLKVLVAEGVYKPGAGLQNTNVGVTLSGNITLSGGYSSDYSAQIGLSTLDGTNNLYHVVKISGNSNTINGFRIAHGNANGSDNDGYGGGIIFSSGFLSLVTNTDICSNSAIIGGGGVAFRSSGMHTVYGNIFNNTASIGGGIYNNFINNSFFAKLYNNSASSNGGGVYNDGMMASSIIIDGVLSNNAASMNGGAIYDTYTSGLIVKGVIVHNTASSNGGAVYLYRPRSQQTFTGYFCNNTASSGGFLYLDLPMSASLLITNSILTNNSAANGIITIYNMLISSLNLSGNIFGGNTSSGYPIYETGMINLSGQTISNNIFITNRLGYLYYDYVYGNIGITEIGKLNTTDYGGINYTGASVITNNIATNM